MVELRYRDDNDLYLEHMEIHLIELKKWAMPKRFSDEDLWAFMLSRPHEHFELPQLFSNSIMRRVMSQIREISEKEVKWARYHSRLMWELDQATIRKEQEQIKQDLTALQQDNTALKQDNTVLQQDLERSEQEKAELLARIAELESNQ